MVRPQHEIVVTKDKLTSRSLSPSSDELFELMHLTSCEHAIKKWKDEWLICPVCNQSFAIGFEGAYTVHKRREDIVC